MMRLCALAVLLAAAAHADKDWSKPNSRSDWIPLHAPRDLDVAAQEQVPTILRPPAEPAFVRHTRLIQPPRGGRTEFAPPQPYYPGDQSHLVRFPGQQNIPLRGGPLPQNFNQNFNQNFRQGPPQFVPQQQQQQQQQQPQFNGPQSIPLRPQNQSFVPAGPQDEVQLVYVPVEALPPFQRPSNNVLVKQKPPQNFPLPPPGQFARQPQPQQGPFGNQQQLFEQEALRIARLKEQEERQRIKEQELRERQEQEKRIRQEAEDKQRQQQQKQQQQLFRPAQSVTPASNLKAQENIFQQRFPQTTELPVNPAPHQPPLSVYLTAGGLKKLTVDDVIDSLKDATTIPVLDTLPDTKSPPPQIFVGPAEMTAPIGYSKFDLPYLNSLDTNRVERKVEQLPFFVAPLSYNQPQGYNKIPFPAPHVGSVVVAPGSRHFNHGPVTPQPHPQEQFINNEQSQISPAIPLLVNSLQAGPQRQRFHYEQQQQQQQQEQQDQEQEVIPQPPPSAPVQRFPPPPAAPVQRFPAPPAAPVQRFPPPPPPAHRFPSPPTPQPVQSTEPQFIYRDEQNFGPQAAPPQPTFVRQHNRHQQHQPQHVEQYIRQEVTPAHHFAPPQQQQLQFVEQTVHHQPEFHQQFHQFRQEEAQVPEEPQFENEVQTEAPEPITVPITTTTTTQAPQRPATRVRTRPQSVSTTAAPRTRAPVRNYDETTERRPVNRGRRPVQRERTTTPEPEVEEQPEEQYLDTPRENSVRHQEFPAPNYPLPPSQLSPFNNQQKYAQIPTTHQQFDAQPQFPAFQGQFEHNFRSLPAPNPQIGVTYVNNGAPENHRANFQGEQLHNVSPSTIDYPTASPALQPQLSLKGETGQVHHSPSPTPFAPTPLPSSTASPSPSYAPSASPSYVSSASPSYAPSASPSFAPSALPTFVPTLSPSFAPALETEAPEVIPEVASTEEPQRTRQRIPEGGARQRVRVQAEGQRFRARPVANREENTEENAPQHTPQRPRGRQVVRVRATTESPAAEGENVPDRDVSRTKTRFRAIDRTRIGARQQQVVRSRQPIAQDEVELPKPVRHGPSTDRVINDSPVFASENEGEVEIATVRSTTEAATTQKPGRRFNNFGVGQRTRRIRPVANQEQTESTTTSAPPSRNFATARPIRRQSTAAPIARSTLRGGARLRKPTTTESPEIEEAVANVQTGVIYSKNQFVKVVKEEAPEEEQAPVRAVPKKVAAKVQPVENYPPNYNFDEDAPETVVYRPRIRVPSRTRYTPAQEDSEFNVEESQRSEQFSIQQLDDAVSLLKTYYNTKYDEDVPSDVEGISFTEPQPESTDLPIVEEQSTELKLEADTTEAVPTTEQVPEVNTAPTEEPKVEKYSSKIKASAPLKRRIRIKKRPVADDFETAESQNIAAAAQNSLSSVKIPEKKVNAVKEIILLSATPSLITSTTTTTEIPVTTTAPEVAETVTARGTETTPPTPDELTTVSDVATTTTPEAETTTDEQVTHILGTSTTTEISLETEICYKGRCIKTKVDADQNPIE